MSLLKRHWISVVTVGLGLLAGVVYYLVSPPQYEVGARVVVHRDPVELPNFSPEASKNRWIWVRDGYALKDSLLSQDFLSALVQGTPSLQARFEAFRKCHERTIARSGAGEADVRVAFLEEFKKTIDVDYLGGDAFSFVFRVRDKDAALAKGVATALVGRLRELVVEETRGAYARSVDALTQELGRAPSDLRPYLSETLRGVVASRVLFEASADRRVEVVQPPAIPVVPFWPKLDRLVLLALVVGLAAGLLIELALGWPRHGLRAS